MVCIFVQERGLFFLITAGFSQRSNTAWVEMEGIQGQEEEERWVGATGMMAKEMMGHQRCSAFVRAMRGVSIECVLHAYRFELLYCLYRLYGLCVYCMYTGLS